MVGGQMKRIDQNSFSLLFSFFLTSLFTPSIDDDAGEDKDKDEDEAKEEEDEDEDKDEEEGGSAVPDGIAF